MEKESDFIKLLGQCDFCLSDESPLEDFQYNSFKYIDGVESYEIYLGRAFCWFMKTIRGMGRDERKKVLKEAIIIRNRNYDVPTHECLDRMVEEMAESRNTSLRNELERLRFVRQMRDVQERYIKGVIDYLETLENAEITLYNSVTPWH
jgi:hypothetical protein